MVRNVFVAKVVVNPYKFDRICAVVFPWFAMKWVYVLMVWTSKFVAVCCAFCAEIFRFKDNSRRFLYYKS